MRPCVLIADVAAFCMSAWAPAILAAYLVGSIPFGLIIARAHGKDLRSIGSGNIGATNVARALGKKWAYVCFFLDVCKGLVPTLLAVVGFGRWDGTAPVVRLVMSLAVGVAAILGHVFPVYLRFKGGKGVATSLGVALGLWPWYTVSAAIALVTWVLVVVIWRYVSLASIAGAVAFCTSLVVAIAVLDSWALADLWPLLPAAFAIVGVVIFRHRTNIKRLLSGTEHKIGHRG